MAVRDASLDAPPPRDRWRISNTPPGVPRRVRSNRRSQTRIAPSDTDSAIEPSFALGPTVAVAWRSSCNSATRAPRQAHHGVGGVKMTDTEHMSDAELAAYYDRTHDLSDFDLEQPEVITPARRRLDVTISVRFSPEEMDLLAPRPSAPACRSLPSSGPSRCSTPPAGCLTVRPCADSSRPSPRNCRRSSASWREPHPRARPRAGQRHLRSRRRVNPRRTSGRSTRDGRCRPTGRVLPGASRAIPGSARWRPGRPPAGEPRTSRSGGGLRAATG